ncbi:VpsF family polysaccharide biosynthesis protein [Rhodopseudomonas boonkerdii]|uniref:VpsF family polysaccharide biosynthesis protein n=1 Tax=Rhodopseudomonas boonkerdii TaxID=475937 RepID=UPI001E3C1B9A|nr:VpsF family polysaccharide biosynthesis protein [Rhodopseudomonas boonkerdii]
MTAIQTASPQQLQRHGAFAAARGVRVPQRRPLPDIGQLVTAVVVGLLTIATIAIFTLSGSVLTNLKIHYLTAGGNFLEKLHPTTYLTFVATLLLLMRRGDPIEEINRTFSEAKLLLIHLFCWFCLLIQMFVLDRPFTVIIDTFLLPVLLCLLIWRLTPQQRRPLIWALHATMLLNILIGYYEFVSGHRIVPLTLGSVVVMGEWRSAALLGHPLTASGIVAAYIMALVLRPAVCPPLLIRIPLIAFALGSLMAFGGRTALMTVLAVLALTGLIEAFNLIRGKRIPLLVAAGAICLIFAAVGLIFAAYSLGIFDKMLLRFSSDKGSALARVATFDMLSHFQWSELVLGPNPVRVNALQSQLGLNYGIENFWVSCIVQFGLVHTILITLGLTCFTIELMRRSSPAAWAVLLLILMIAASSVSFSSKNIQLAQLVLLTALLLPHDPRPAAPSPQLRARRPQVRHQEIA